MTEDNLTVRGYEVSERLWFDGGGGGFKAYQPLLNREVVIAQYTLGMNPNIRQTVPLAARLLHPHITPIFDYWHESHTTYMVMPFMKGGDLWQKLGVHGALSLEDTSRLVRQIASALDYIHRQNILHRDLGPSAVSLDADGNFFLGNFEFALDLTNNPEPSQEDSLVGQLHCISPEQARGESITQRTDIFGFGLLVYEALNGVRPWHDLSVVERVLRLMNDSLPDITTLPDDISHAVNKVLKQATAKAPSDRFPDALSFETSFAKAANPRS